MKNITNGIDIVYIPRMKETLNDKIIKKIFTINVVKYINSRNNNIDTICGLFAAKEAFSKALGTGIKNFSLKDLYIKNNKDGKPEFFFNDSLKQILQNRCGECVVHVSLSHETDYAIAYVVIEKI